MHKIKEMLMKEIYEYEDKAKKSSGKLSAGDLETIHKLTDTVKNIDKIEMLEDEEMYSGNVDFMTDGRVYGTSYRDRNRVSYARGRSAKRDSMGRYSRDGAKESLIEKLEEAIDEATDEHDKEKIRKVIMQIENA